MKRFWFVAYIFAILSMTIASASARIGWTLSELEKNYGPAKTHISKNFGWTDYDFTVGPLSITAVLGEDGKVAREEIVKISKEEFSPEEFQAILEKNADGSAWDWDEKKTETNGGKESTMVVSVKKGQIYLVAYLDYISEFPDPAFPVQGSFWMVNIETETQIKRQKKFFEDQAGSTTKGL